MNTNRIFSLFALAVPPASPLANGPLTASPRTRRPTMKTRSKVEQSLELKNASTPRSAESIYSNQPGISYRTALSIIFILLLFAAQQAQAITFTVTNANDYGAGSLQQAILDADATTTADTIEFNIGGGGAQTINLPGNFSQPAIRHSLTIDGTSQPGYVGVPLIEINNTNSSANNAFFFEDISGAEENYIIRGLIINRASGAGILVWGNNVSHTTTITGCYIGTNSSGTTDLGNGGNGIAIYRGKAIIGGTAFGERNVISGNNGNGIYVANFGSAEIYNNYIGTNAAGTGDLGNTGSGIYLEDGAIIGGTSGSGVSRGNVISGNSGNGITINTYFPVTIQRNLIGTNAAGTGDLGNSQNGILISRGACCSGDNHLIGSSASSLDGNVISGNGGDVNNGKGIKITADSTGGTQIFGNRIGTNSAGTAVLQNDSDGIEITDSGANEIGLAGNSAARNTIAGNNLHGIVLSGADSTQNFIQNNFIGTNSSGTDLGNGGDGINITSAGLNTVGGGAANAGNTIAFNDNAHGVNINTGSIGNSVQFNTIHHNTGNGVHVSSTSNSNSIRQNAIYLHQNLGINLGALGVTPNDTNDPDTGANNLQNFPVLQKASPVRIGGTLNSLADQTFTIDFYRVDSCNPSGHGEGRYHLVSTNTTTAGSNAAFNFPYAGLSVGEVVTATATDSQGNTSEFSQCLAVTADSGDVRLSSATYSTNENGGSALITVNRIGATGGTITVDYSTSNGTATAGADYTATSGTLTFLNGETTKTFSVPLTDDNSDEPNQTFNVALSNPTGGALLLTPASAVVTITDNDNPPTISITDVSLEEGNSGTSNFIFTVDLSAASGFDVSVNFATANSTATAGIDYTSASGTLNFSSALAETSKTVTIAVQGDLTVEIDEAFFVNLTAPINATIADAQGIGTILDDDNAGKLQFSAASYNTPEGANVIITVTRTNGDAGTVSVDYATGGGTATPNADYTSASGTLTFNDGETSKDFGIAILSDSDTEPSEDFNIALTNPVGGATLGAASSSVVHILPPAPTITSFLPTSGLVGSSVTIFGSNLAGATAVGFNGVAASFAVESDTEIVALVPAGADTGSIAVTASGSTVASDDKFVVLADSDGDGLSDDFEAKYPDAGEPEKDTDGDGQTNLAEYRAGTDPIDPQSVLRIIKVRREGNDIVIVFEALAEKRYRMQASADLMDSFPTTVETFAPSAADLIHEVTDAEAALQPERFYRIEVLP